MESQLHQLAQDLCDAVKHYNRDYHTLNEFGRERAYEEMLEYCRKLQLFLNETPPTNET